MPSLPQLLLLSLAPVLLVEGEFSIPAAGDTEEVAAGVAAGAVVLAAAGRREDGRHEHEADTAAPCQPVLVV